MREVVLLAAAVLLPGAAAASGSTLDRVRHAGVLACGVVTEPADYTHDDAHGPIPAFGVDLCRAVAAAVLGEADRARLIGEPDETGGVSALLAGKIDVLMGATPSPEVAGGRGVAFGRPVFLDSQGVLVRASSGIATLAGLAGRQVCFIPGQPGHEALTAALAQQHVTVLPFPFQELGEMEAAFAGGRCQAMAGPISQLAESRAAFGSRSGGYALLPLQLTRDAYAPVVRAGDPAWHDAVDAVTTALIQAELDGVTQANAAARAAAAATDRGTGSRDRSGLRGDWAARAVAAVGNYGEVFERDLGRRSPLQLSRGSNRALSQGGALVPQNLE